MAETMTEYSTPIPWSSIDDAIWEHIFNYVPLRIRIRMEVVCRRWCKALRSKRLWSTLPVSTDPQLRLKCDPGEIAAFVSHSALGAPRKPLVNGLNFWARFSPIREIDMNGAVLTTDALMKYLHVLGHCKKLETLKMSHLRSASGDRTVFFLSKDFKRVVEFIHKAEKLKCFEMDARVQGIRSLSSLQKWLDPWQWHTIIEWLMSSDSVVRVRHLEIMDLPISTFARMPDDRQTYLEDYVHPFVNLERLANAIRESQVLSLSMGRGCHLGDEGTLLLLDRIRWNASMRELHIRHGQITSSGAKKMADVIQRGCPPLNVLDLRSNVIRKGAAGILRKVLQSIETQLLV